MSQKPKLLTLQQLNKIHITHPDIGKALQSIVEYVNKNVTPKQGSKV